ncbi:MAG: hypothetical protein HC828_13620, partial [Blastochloris sp.]|nr:hypothetical protein [Blastochloris sp.]
MILASDWIAFHADRTPEKPAAIDQATGRRFTYGDLETRSGRLAASRSMASPAVSSPVVPARQAYSH